MYALNLKTVYDFEMHPTPSLGERIRNATVLAILDYDSAQVIEDVGAKHQEVYPYLPPGTPKNPRDLIYVKIRTSTGQIRAVAMDWIAVQPVVVTATVATVTVSNITLGDLPALRNALLKNGFSNIEIATQAV